MYKQLKDTPNEEFRNSWVLDALACHKPNDRESSLLDVGAGLSPYKDAAISLGFTYYSQDFGNYVPKESTKIGGLVNATWDYPKHDYICDILALPFDLRVDVILCTEVFEHIPDPIKAFEKLSAALSPEGIMIVTVPFSSLMHQAPYWFQAGLSPFWFEYWAKEFNVEVLELTVYGDYIDQMTLEMTRLFPFLSFIPGALKLLPWLARRYRGTLSEEVLSSGGHGVVFIGKKTISSG